MILNSVALRPHTPSVPQPPHSVQLNCLFSALEAGKQFLDTLLSFPVNEYHLVSFVEWVRLPLAIMTIARLCMPTGDHLACGWDAQSAGERVRLELCLESLCFRMQTLSTYDAVKQPHLDFWRAMSFMMDLTKNWYLRKTQGKAPSHKVMEPSPGTSNGTGMTKASCPMSAVTTAFSTQGSEEPCPAFPDVDLSCEVSQAIDSDVDPSSDPFALIKSADFDLEPFFDMAGGIWGDQSYNIYSDMIVGGSAPF